VTARRREKSGGSRRPLPDPLDPLNQRPRRGSRHEQRLEEARHRRQAARRVQRMASEHDAPQELRWALYAVLTVGMSLVVWRLFHWAVWASSGFNAYTRTTTRVVSQQEVPAWIDPVGLAVGLALGLLLTWIYARYFQNL